MLALAGLVACLIVGGFVLFIFSKTGVAFGNGKEAERYRSISPAVILLMVLRAGLVEEIFYRGYLMERLEKISGKWIVYFLFPLIFFGLWHFRQGLPGIILSFSLGAVLAFMYWKKRDLKANIITHFMVDFIPNLLLPLFSNE
jgi:membrane protease YdiL (CAAX protease family)